jgi:hypothetical protein
VAFMVNFMKRVRAVGLLLKISRNKY